MPQIRFSVSKETAGYLKWLGENVLFESSVDQVARRLMLARAEDVRRQYLSAEPAGFSIPPVGEDGD